MNEMEKPKNSPTLNENYLRKLKSAKAGYREKQIPKANINQPQGVALFKSKAQMEVWLFCQQNKISFEDWLNKHIEFHNNTPNPEWFNNPKCLELDRKGELSANDHIRFARKDRNGKIDCAICHSTGWAYLIMGIILENNIPQNLLATQCWCQR